MSILLTMPTFARRVYPLTWALLGWLMAFLPPAYALGLGTATSAALIGQQLDYAIAVRLESDEVLTPECVAAEVQFGDRPVPAAVRLRQGSGNTMVMRITTTAAIDEPVVSIAVSAGCTSRVNRRYVVLADLGPSPAAAPPAATMAPSALPASEVVTGGTPQPGPSGATQAPGAPATAPAGTFKASPTTSQPTAASVSSGATRAAASQRSAAARAERQAQGKARETASRATKAAQASQRRSAARAAPAQEPRARLTLEPAERESASQMPSAVEEALAAVAQAASQARAAAEAASATSARMAELERNVERTRAEAQASKAEAEALRAQVRQTATLPWWSYALFGFSVLMALVAAWLAWRMRGMQQVQEVAWARASAMPDVPAMPSSPSSDAATEAPLRETSPLPLITSELTQPAPLVQARMSAASGGAQIVAKATAAGPRNEPPSGGGYVQSSRSETPLDERDLPSERTMVLPPSARVDDPSPRDVSIEELIDVDQQAEFFVAIGQDHAAIELLVAHLRNTGGGSPLTYLKLLDIYQRIGQQEEYERTRSRFNHRFNAYAPKWGEDLRAGRSLEDYEGVLPRLQAAWARPLDAMAELEALLFRKSRGELFDLNAYREVLFLYSLARDLLERDNGERDNVDLLLPLNLDDAPPDPLVGDSRATSDVPLDDHPTAPLDLDLTPHIPAQSIFGEQTIAVPPRTPRNR